MLIIRFDPTGKVVAVDGRTPIRLPLGPMARHRVKKGWGLGLVNSNGEEWFVIIYSLYNHNNDINISTNVDNNSNKNER